MLIAGIFLAGCGDDDENPEPTPVPETYNVTYSLSVFGGYDDLQVSYFAPHDIRRIKSNPKTPWTEVFTDYRLLDSVALNITIAPLPNKTLNYDWEVRITKGGELIDLNSDSQSGTTGDNPQPVYIEWKQIIE